MQLLERFDTWRKRRKFAVVGEGCRFARGPMEVKGRVELGRGCSIGANTTFRGHKEGVVRLADAVEVGAHAMFHANQEISVGEGTCISAYCVLRDLNHWFYTEEHWRVSPPIIKPIVVGKNCFLGPHSYVMPGITIGDGAVVAPGSVVNRDIAPGEVWAGAPTAQFIAHRTDPERRSTLKRHRDLLIAYGFEDDAADQPR